MAKPIQKEAKMPELKRENSFTLPAKNEINEEQVCLSKIQTRCSP